MSLPLVAIVGAPNVGKSTLFNRLVGRRRAIVTDEPGVTRDRIYGTVADAPTPFRVVDTGGLTVDLEAPYAREIERQAEAALDEAAVMLFVVDARAGATATDLELAAILRRHRTPLLLVANKIDASTHEVWVHGLHELGLGEPVPISAEHARGIDQLRSMIDARFQCVTVGEPVQDLDRPVINVALVGRPNVGKSSITNRLLGQDRVVVSDQPGTTRDAIDTLLEVGERRYCLIDTAGIRRPGKRRGVERFSVDRARENIDRCDVAILILDASQALAAQDTHVAGYVLDASKPLLVAINKWDLVDEREQAARNWESEVRRRLRFARYVPMILVSARTGQRVMKLLDRVDELHAVADTWIRTVEFNRWVEDLVGAPGAAPARGHGFKIYYGTQTGTRPPTFLIFCNDPRKLHFSARRYLENSLRKRFGLGGAPIRMRFRGRRKERAG